MAMKRKNKAEFVGDGNQPWFNRNVKRQRQRSKVAKLSRRKNRGK